MAASHSKRIVFPRKTLYTIGHSVHPISDFLKLLNSAGPRISLVDVRTTPRARRPWFNQDRLSAALASEGHNYAHFPILGGRQRMDFYDYTETDAYQDGIAQVLDLARKPLGVVLLCSESNPQECHRWNIATSLTVNDVRVYHILKTGKLLLHTAREIT